MPSPQSIHLFQIPTDRHPGSEQKPNLKEKKKGEKIVSGSSRSRAVEKVRETFFEQQHYYYTFDIVSRKIQWVLGRMDGRRDGQVDRQAGRQADRTSRG